MATGPEREDEPTVFIIDDDPSVREALIGMVQSVGLRVEAFASAQAFLEITPPDEPSCLVLDVRLPGLSGLELQQELAKANARMPIVFITGFGDIPMTVRAMKAGAVEFLTKPFRDQELLDAIQHGLAQDRAIRGRRAEMATVRERFQTLTPREREVMRLVVAGKLNREIATQLGTSEITVKVRRGHVMRKLQAESPIDLARMAALLEQPDV
jgi:FixJ family two-component response regulator